MSATGIKPLEARGQIGDQVRYVILTGIVDWWPRRGWVALDRLFERFLISVCCTFETRLTSITWPATKKMQLLEQYVGVVVISQLLF